MSYRDILVHVESGERAGERGHYAVALASAHGAHLSALAFAPSAIVPNYGDPGIVAPLPQSFFDDLERDAKAALARIETAAAQAGVPFSGRVSRGMAGDLPQLIAIEARTADLTVVGQPRGDALWSNRGEVISRLLMGSGRPLLVVPHTIGAFVGIRRVLAAWDGGAEASRAIHDALPLLKTAQHTQLFIAEPTRRSELVGDEPGSSLARHLAHHGVAVEVRLTHSDDLSVGELILARAADEAADLIVMGGFHHSRLRELLIGGVTRTVLENMPVPVLLSH